MSSRLSDRAMAGAVRLGSGAALQMAVQVISLAVLARLLDPADFGLFAAANVVVGLGRLLADFSIGAAVIQRQRLDASIMGAALAISVSAGAALAGGVLVGGPWIATTVLNAPEAGLALQALAPVFLFGGLTSVGEAIVSRELRFGALAVTSVTTTALFNGALAIALAYAGFGWWSLVIAALCRSAAFALAMIILAGHSLRPCFDRTAIRELLSTGSALSLARIANYGATAGDTLMVGRILGVEALGLYDRAFKVATLPSALYGRSASRVALSSMAAVSGDPARLAAAFRRGMSLTALIGAPLTAALGALGPEIVAVFLGEGWSAATPVFQTLVLATFLRLAYRVSQSTLLACGWTYRYAITQAIYAAAVCGGVAVAAPYGLIAAAIAVNFAIAANFVLLTHLAVRSAGAGWGLACRAMAPGLFWGVVAAGCVFPLAVALRDVGLHPFVVLVGATSGCFLAVGCLQLCAGSFLLGEDGVWLRGVLLKRIRTLQPGRSTGKAPS